jgi:hypothetical protein
LTKIVKDVLEICRTFKINLQQWSNGKFLSLSPSTCKKHRCT